MRELVSNAWDANATQVIIDTNHPNFFQLVIEDKGEGFSREDFETLMGGGIGNSTKRTQAPKLNWGRPTIGRLGIGMLGIAQICGSFRVISRPRTGKGFRARVILYDLAKTQWNDPSSPLVHKTFDSLQGEAITDTIVDVGSYEFEDFEETEYPCGTRILVDDVVPQFTEAFHQSLQFGRISDVPREWQKAVTTILHNATSLQELGDYWRLLWELSVACPLPYQIMLFQLR
ncbi:MAG: ATP-binding protein [Alphaproteobacteria bacterium]|nr:ATP-binding protein [Alphaproteobacteria bacterium]